MMNDGQARRIAEKALEPGERIVWAERSRTRSYAMRYVPGNVLALVVTFMVAQRTVLHATGHPSTWSWIVLALLVLANVAGIRSVILEMDVHWAVTNRRLLRVRRNGVRTYAAEHFDSISVSDDTLVLAMTDDGVHEDEPKRLELRALEGPQQARQAIEALISRRRNAESH
jgi:hypothetical protein